MSAALSDAAVWEAGPPSPSELLRLHRRSLSHLLVIGGSATDRAGIAARFHRGSILRLGPLVILDCGREEARLERALQNLLMCVGSRAAGDPLRAAECGTLFLDSVDQLSRRTQSLLYRFLEAPCPTDIAQPATRWFGRMAAGCAVPLERAVAKGRFHGALLDCLDKIRIRIPATGMGGPS